MVLGKDRDMSLGPNLDEWYWGKSGRCLWARTPMQEGDHLGASSVVNNLGGVGVKAGDVSRPKTQ